MTSKRNESDREYESNRAISRRDGLKVLGLGLGLGAGVFSTAGRAASGSSESTQTKTYSLRQDGKSVPLTPLVGKKPVQKLYDYTYPTKLFKGTPGSFGWSYSSEGMTHLLRNQTSVLFLYRGPNGLSLVVCHGRYTKNGSDPGGAVTFTITDFPKNGKWLVKDDFYVSRKTGKKYKTNSDTWSINGDRSVVNWTYKSNRTDGGVLGGLGKSFDFTIHPAFNKQAKLYNKGQHGRITHWQALSGDLGSPNRIELRMDRPVTISSKPCGSADGKHGKGNEGQNGSHSGGNGRQHDRGDGGRKGGRRDGSGKKGQNCNDGASHGDGRDDHRAGDHGHDEDRKKRHKKRDCEGQKKPKHGRKKHRHHHPDSNGDRSDTTETESDDGGC